ncbi:MAG: hypothetical protein H0X43_03465 [Nitrosospira sp.]|nr:hypothetical protein [Nitrosospira sp.]
MKYTLLAIAMTTLLLSACDSKKHPMDKPPPSAMVERDSAPNFDELDNEDTGAKADSSAQAYDSGAGSKGQPEDHSLHPQN